MSGNEVNMDDVKYEESYMPVEQSAVYMNEKPFDGMSRIGSHLWGQYSAALQQGRIDWHTEKKAAKTGVEKCVTGKLENLSRVWTCLSKDACGLDEKS